MYGEKEREGERERGRKGEHLHLHDCERVKSKSKLFVIIQAYNTATEFTLLQVKYKTAIEAAAAPGGGGGVLSGATFTGMYWTSSPQPSLCVHLAQSQRALMSPDAVTLGPGMYFIIII